jgi:nucleoside-diphosphate-sugar epimerase
LKIDFGGSQNVLQISNNTRSVKQLIYSSSAAAYGGHPDNELWLSESQELRPGKYRYGIIKKLVEESLSKASIREEFKIVCLRICSVIGPSFNKRKSAFSIFANSKIGLKQWEQNKVQFLHEDDMNSLITLILNDNQVNGIFNLAPDSYSNVKELIPNKKYYDIPIPLITAFLWICWNLRIMNLHPACIKHGLYPIILNPAKLISKYNYKFRYSTAAAFNDTLKYFHPTNDTL